MKNWLFGKDPDNGEDWRQKEKGMTENEMVGWHHWLDGRVFEQAPGVGDGQGSLVCCSPWGPKESDMTERLNWTDDCPPPQPTPLRVSCYKASQSINVQGFVWTYVFNFLGKDTGVQWLGHKSCCRCMLNFLRHYQAGFQSEMISAVSESPSCSTSMLMLNVIFGF